MFCIIFCCWFSGWIIIKIKQFVSFLNTFFLVWGQYLDGWPLSRVLAGTSNRWEGGWTLRVGVRNRNIDYKDQVSEVMTALVKVSDWNSFRANQIHSDSFRNLFPRQSELIRINPKKVLNLVWCNPVKN